MDRQRKRRTKRERGAGGPEMKGGSPALLDARSRGGDGWRGARVKLIRVEKKKKERKWHATSASPRDTINWERGSRP